jgi:hypothetical protein
MVEHGSLAIAKLVAGTSLVRAQIGALLSAIVASE